LSAKRLAKSRIGIGAGAPNAVVEVRRAQTAKLTVFPACAEAMQQRHRIRAARQANQQGIHRPEATAPERFRV
jgi:hypothetical protein